MPVLARVPARDIRLHPLVQRHRGPFQQEELCPRGGSRTSVVSCLTSGGSYLHVTAEPGFYPRERFGGVAGGRGAAAGAAGLTRSCPGETEEHPDRRSPHLLNQLPPGFLEGTGATPPCTLTPPAFWESVMCSFIELRATQGSKKSSLLRLCFQSFQAAQSSDFRKFPRGFLSYLSPKSSQGKGSAVLFAPHQHTSAGERSSGENRGTERTPWPCSAILKSSAHKMQTGALPISARGSVG